MILIASFKTNIHSANPMTNDLLLRFRALWDPNRFHGWGKKRRYFEGWYIKVVDPTERFAWAFIPGISMAANGERHAFIQSLDGKKRQAAYHRFNARQFQPAEDRFSLHLGDNFFSGEQLQVFLPNVQGRLFFENCIPWPKKPWAPGVMNWYSFAPFMECYHGVVSMNHQIKGSLTIHGETVDFTGGKGYIEKDWGASFPKSWIWMQTNHFDEPDVSLFASVAHIPWLKSFFIGYIVGFWLRGKLYTFATYTGAKMKIALLNDRQVKLTFTDKTKRLEIEGTKEEGGGLISPISGEMTGKVNESLEAVVDVALYEHDQLIFKGRGRNAGMELAGEIHALL